MTDATKHPKPIDALRMVVEALESLDGDERQRVIAAALELLGAPVSPRQPTLQTHSREEQGKPAASVSVVPQSGRPPDIKTLKEDKNPRSAVEMATLVAYYLAEVALQEEQKPHIGKSDLNKYFKQARYPVPRRPEMTLVNAKDAGYLEALGDGNYRLNPVGYNLIAHVLGRGEEPRTKPAVKRKRKLRERSKTESRKKRKSAGKKPV